MSEGPFSCDAGHMIYIILFQRDHASEGLSDDDLPDPGLVVSMNQMEIIYAISTVFIQLSRPQDQHVSTTAAAADVHAEQAASDDHP